jgi:hypothetical protein
MCFFIFRKGKATLFVLVETDFAENHSKLANLDQTKTGFIVRYTLGWARVPIITSCLRFELGAT